MRTVGIAFALAVSLAVSGAALAHEGHEHKLMGTVSAVNQLKLELDTQDGHKETVALDKTTKCLRGKQPATIQDIKVGDRVVVTLVDGPQGKVAKEVLLAAGDKAVETPPASEPHKH